MAELETNDKARPIHTSVGVWVSVEPLDKPKVNAQNDEYTWVARDMLFDHDAILLDSVGAAQPHQGVGLAVNSEGEEIEVQQALVTIDADDLGEMSHSEVREALDMAISQPPLSGDWVTDVFDSTVIYWADDLLFSAPYIFEGRTAKITGLPIPVERDVTYIPKTNNSKGDPMRDIMLKALADAGITVNADISDADLLAQYNTLTAKQNSDEAAAAAAAATGDDAAAAAGDVPEALTNALKPLSDKLDGLEQKINQKDTDELDRLATIVGNSEAHPGLDVDAAKLLPLATLKGMVANCQTSHGVPLHVNEDGSSSEAHSYDMPA